MVTSPNQWFQVLRGKLQPSFDVQGRGSVNRAIRSSSTFGPQINHNKATSGSLAHKQKTSLMDAFNRMNQ